VAVEVVTVVGGGAGHGRRPMVPKHRLAELGLGYLLLLVRDGVPDGEAMPIRRTIAPAEKDAAVAGVDGAPAVVAPPAVGSVCRRARAEGGRGDKACRRRLSQDACALADTTLVFVGVVVVVSDLLLLGGAVVEHAEQGRGRSRTAPRAVEVVELAEPAAERGAGDEAAPGLADEGGADEARGIARREADKDLFHELIHQLRRRHHAVC